MLEETEKIGLQGGCARGVVGLVIPSDHSHYGITIALAVHSIDRSFEGSLSHGIYYRITIAFAIRSFDPSLFVRLMV